MRRETFGIAVMSALWVASAHAQTRGVIPRHITAQPPAVRHYIVPRATHPMIIDGKLDEPAWRAAPWTDDFVDILGADAPRPRYRTRAKLVWDDSCLYVGAELEEPQLWATLTERDAVIFHDDDFEVFIDPDGDTQNYFELEINALGTAWDLLLERAYRDGGPPVNAWDIVGLRSGVALHGTLNDPADRDSGWTVELALPWRSLSPTPGAGRAPQPGDQWRLNFSRVEWRVDARAGRYVKRVDPATGDTLPEDNWVWSPQDEINMHMPEMWGVLQFDGARAGAALSAYHADPDRTPRWRLRRVYYAERAFAAAHGGRYADTLDRLTFDPPLDAPGAVTLHTSATGYEVTTPTADDLGSWHLTGDGRLWRE